MKHHDIQLTGSISITGSLTVPVGTTAERPLNPKSGSIRMNTTTGVLEIYTAVSGAAWETVGEQSPTAATLDLEYLLIAGGGGGGRYGGGGGAGGYLSSSLASVESGSGITVTVGGGGAGHVGDAQSGGTGTVGTDSSIAGVSITTITSNGGGGGGNYSNPGSTASNGGDGGSGGGGGRTNSSGNAAGGSGTVGQGNDGGGSSNNYANHNGGGGGGAGSAGASGVNGGSAGGGGNGLASSITGTSVTRAGGGGGSHQTSGTVSGGTGGGGTGYGPTATATTDADGDTNTGGGGGGTSDNSIGGTARAGNGGSGVAIFAYDSGSGNCAGGIVGDAGNGRRYHQFNSSDILRVGSTTDYLLVTDSLALSLDAGNFASRNASSWTDISGQGSNITFSTTPSLGTNFYYTFGGSIRGYTSTAIINSNSFSLEAWVRTTTVSGWHTAVGTHGTYRQIGINGTVFKFGGNAGGGNLFIDGTTTVSTNVWYHMCMTVTNNAAIGYINGAQEVSGDIGSNGGTIGATVLSSYASNSNSETWTGDIAQVRVYNKQLSAAEVAQNYEATKTNFV